MALTLGLFSRSRVIVWPWWVTAYVGDALWAWLVFLGFGWLWTRWSTSSAVCVAFTPALASRLFASLASRSASSRVTLADFFEGSSE